MFASPLQSQIDPQTKHRNSPVFGLTSPFTRFGKYAGWQVDDLHGSFHLIAMLTARSRTTVARQPARFEQRFGRQRRGMRHNLITWIWSE